MEFLKYKHYYIFIVSDSDAVDIGKLFSKEEDMKELVVAMALDLIEKTDADIVSISRGWETLTYPVFKATVQYPDYHVEVCAVEASYVDGKSISTSIKSLFFAKKLLESKESVIDGSGLKVLMSEHTNEKEYFLSQWKRIDFITSKEELLALLNILEKHGETYDTMNDAFASGKKEFCGIDISNPSKRDFVLNLFELNIFYETEEEINEDLSELAQEAGMTLEEFRKDEDIEKTSDGFVRTLHDEAGWCNSSRKKILNAFSRYLNYINNHGADEVIESVKNGKLISGSLEITLRGHCGETYVLMAYLKDDEELCIVEPCTGNKVFDLWLDIFPDSTEEEINRIKYGK